MGIIWFMSFSFLVFLVEMMLVNSVSSLVWCMPINWGSSYELLKSIDRSCLVKIFEKWVLLEVMIRS